MLMHRPEGWLRGAAGRVEGGAACLGLPTRSGRKGVGPAGALVSSTDDLAGYFRLA